MGDSPNPPGRPWVTLLLIAANVTVYLALLPQSFSRPELSDPALRDYVLTLAQERGLAQRDLLPLARQVTRFDLIVFAHGFRPAAFSVADLFTSMFLHSGLAHLFGNMLFLFIYGDNVEHRLGRVNYLLAYLGTGVVASLGDGWLRSGSDIPSVGASGAISGVLGLYFVWFPRNRVRTWVFLFPLFMNVVELPARLVLGFYLLIQNLLPWLLSSGEAGVAYGAHLGGFLGGLGLAAAVDRFPLARPERDVGRVPAGVVSDPAGPAVAFRDALAIGRFDLAAAWFFASAPALIRTEVGPAEKVALGELLERNGHPHAALAAFQRALGDHPRGPARAAAHLGASRVLLNALENPTGAYQHLYGALEEGPSPAEEAAARALLRDLATRVRTLPRRLPE